MMSRTCYQLLLRTYSQIDIAEGFGAGDAKKLEGITDAASACDLHPAAGNIMYCCSEMLEYSACYRKMRELAVTYFTKYTAYLTHTNTA
jgi:hypothetical protein